MSFKLSIGKMARAGSDLYTNEAIAAFEPIGDELNPRYLFHALPGVLGDSVVDQAIKGATLNKKKLASISLPLPPRSEQDRIAEMLDNLDGVIQSTEYVHEKQRLLQEGLLISLVSPTSPPTSWARSTLGEVADWVSGGTPSKSYQAFWGGDVPWVSPKDMKVFLLRDTQDHLTTLGARGGTKIVPRHSVLVVVRGMILAHTFPVCLTQREMAINQDVKAVVARPGVSGEFLGYWFRAHAERLLRLVSEATHGTKKIDLDDLKKFQILLPSVDEQQRIASILAAGDENLAVESALLATLRAIKHGLSSDLLTGRVRSHVH
jgi:type I restriction enzyme S subunit